MDRADTLLQKADQLYTEEAYAEAAEYCRRVLEQCPSHVRARMLLGGCQKAMGRFSQAAATFRRAAEDEGGKDPKVMAIILTVLGLCLAKLRQYRAATEALSRSITLDPTADRYSLLGAVLADHGQSPVEAERAFRKAIELNPNHDEAMLGLGQLLARQERHQEAIRFFLRSAELDSTKSSVFFHLALELLSLKKYAEAEEALRKALALNESDARAHTLLALALAKQGGRIREELTHLNRAIELVPGLGSAHYFLSDTYRRLGRADEADFHAERADQLKWEEDRWSR